LSFCMPLPFNAILSARLPLLLCLQLTFTGVMREHSFAFCFTKQGHATTRTQSRANAVIIHHNQRRCSRRGPLKLLSRCSIPTGNAVVSLATVMSVCNNIDVYVVDDGAQTWSPPSLLSINCHCQWHCLRVLQGPTKRSLLGDSLKQ
jgi:hypothetical protein